MGKSGRPTKYKPEHCQLLVDYFDIEPFEDKELPHYQDDGESIKWMDYKRVACRLPTLRRFAKTISVDIRTVYFWLDEKHGSYQEEFFHAFTQAKEIRKEFLVENALQGMYPPATFKFVAVNLTDMRDTQETVHDVKGDLAAFLEQLDGINGKPPSETGD